MILAKAVAAEPVGRSGTKSAAAFRTIAEVAAELDLPSHVLRFWESKFPQIKPLKRRGGRRYYRPEDVMLLRRVRGLLYTEGYTIKGVQRLLREGGGVASAVPSVDGGRQAVAAGDSETISAFAVQTPPPAGSGERALLRELLADLTDLRASLDCARR